MIDNKRLLGVDVIKMIAIILVIATHVPLFQYDFINDSSVGVLLQFVFKMISEGVPLFFAVNGFLLLKKSELSLDRHFRKMGKILLLLVFWALFLIVINLLYDKTPINRSVIIDLFVKTKGGSLYTGELWFLQALFAVYAVYPFLWIAFHSERKLFFVFFGILLCFACIGNLLNVTVSLLDNPIHIEHLSNLNSFINKLKIIDQYEWFVLYFMLGGIVSAYTEQIEKRKMMLVLLWLVLWLSFFSLSYFISVRKSQLFDLFISNSSIFQLSCILCAFSVFMSFNISGLAGKIVREIGSDTFGIYVTHQFFIRISRLLIPQDNVAERLLIVLSTLVLSCFFTKVMKKIPYLKHLFIL